jgi:hypothetical protein
MVATSEGMLGDELERQATRLVALGFPQVADHVVALKERLGDLPESATASAIPFVLVRSTMDCRT